MSLIRKILKILIIIIIILFVVGIVDYFLVNAGIISIDSDKIPDFLKFLFNN